MNNSGSQSNLKSHDLKLSTAIFMIYSLVAAGAYGIEDMIPSTGPGLTLVILMVLPFIWALPQALVASELGSAIPVEGGYYKWVQRGCGEFWAFQSGWWRTVSCYIDNTVYVILAGGYFSKVVPMTDTQQYFFKVAIILVFTYINLRGLKDVGIVTTIISLLVLAAFAAVTVIGFTHWTNNPFVPFIPENQSLLVSIGGGLSVAMWMYAGYESMSTLGGEVKNKLVIPKAVLFAMPLIALTYILPTMAGLGSVGQWQNWGSEGVSYADVASLAGSGMGVVFAIVALIANCAIFNTYIASTSRGFFAMADDNLAPKALVKCSKKYGVPYISVLALSVFAIIFCRFGFGVVVTIDVMLLMSSYILVWIAGIMLRIKEPGLERPFRIPLGTKGIIVFFAPGLLIAFSALFINGTDYFLGGMLAIVSGPVMYVIFKKKYGGMSKVDPVQYPLNPKTGLGVGDLKRMTFMFGVFTIMGVIAIFFLPWYEAGGAEYYAETYGNPRMFDILLASIRYITIGFGAITLILGFISRNAEPRKGYNIL